MEDCKLGPCIITLKSKMVNLKRKTAGDEASFVLPEGFRFGGVDSIDRTSKNWVEVILWKARHA